MPRRVVLPLDGTDHAENALEMLPQFCDKDDEIVLFSCGEPRRAIRAGLRPGRVISDDRTRPDFPVYAETNDQVIQGQLAELQDYLRVKSSELKKLGFENVQIAVEVSHDPAQAIVQLARHVQPTFIVMVRTAHPGIAERVFGTIAQHVIREDVAPVMILPGHSHGIEPAD